LAGQIDLAFSPGSCHFGTEQPALLANRDQDGNSATRRAASCLGGGELPFMGGLS